MKFRKIKISIFSEDKEYGYETIFKDGLNIIRGDNSSGKSTLVNSLMYSLGMEEIIGSTGVTSLPYAVKEYFDLNDRKIEIIESNVIIEVENKKGDVKCFKRSITSKEKNSKLVEVIEGPYLTSNSQDSYKVSPMFLHDAGAAQNKELGFHAFLESYIGFDLPIVSDNRGGEVKLYLQAIFSALLIEQKRGWTNYIANIPYYRISEVRTKVAQFILRLDTFENDKKLNDLNVEKNKITSQWSESVSVLKSALNKLNFSMRSLSNHPVIGFDPKLVSIYKMEGEKEKGIKEVMSDLNGKVLLFQKNDRDSLSKEPEELVGEIQTLQDEVQELLYQQKAISDQLRINSSKINQYDDADCEILEDLKKNRLTLKVNDFGAKFELNVSKGKCSTCLNPIDDTLSMPEDFDIPMTITENIKYLENQRSMIKSLKSGVLKSLDWDQATLKSINEDLAEKKTILMMLKRDFRSFSDTSEADLRRKIIIEDKLKETKNLNDEVLENLEYLTRLSFDYALCFSKIEKIKKYEFSFLDKEKIRSFENDFKSLVSKFGYGSADVNDINLNIETLTPYLQGLELKEYGSKTSNDIRTDSSASDFVRLIWAYLIALYLCSLKKGGNHPCFLMFDEPAQHSMNEKSVNEMLSLLSQQKSLQSIVAASFDQSESIYKESTKGVEHHLIRLPKKLIH